MLGSADIDRSAFAPLPRPDGPEGGTRRTGVELEFAGLTEAEAAELAAEVLGGDVEPAGAREFRVTGTMIGALKVYLDTAYRSARGPLAEAGLDLARALVPVEIVTEPLLPDDLPVLDTLREALRQAGAEGSQSAALYGFGLHLNPEIPGQEVEDILPIVTAYGLLEDWLRYDDPIDPARRVLPFSDPWPRGFTDALAEAEGWSLDDLTAVYLEHVQSRNRGLDLLPVLATLRPAKVRAALVERSAVKPRPAFHYRLPDSRVNAAGWRIAYEWNRWVIVERLAGEPELLAELRSRWRAHRRDVFSTIADWRRFSGNLVMSRGLAP
ncbi:amidoligase family protein [Pseudoroseicyclus sp. CXY001]|uniref:amidoligase family protein n=1 Tax=Pseudoroseicyclus sp. CXY001 TaxID=3242492 RepID=UPI003570ACDB